MKSSEPPRRIEDFFCHDGHGVMKIDSFSRQSFLDRVFSGFRTHVAATAVCTTGGVHTRTCCTHIFLGTARSLSASHTSHACHIHAWLEFMKKVFVE